MADFYDWTCKLCGGRQAVAENSAVCTCEYCGTTQTLPKITTDRRANLYDRANHFRLNHEYDKAERLFETLLEEDNSDPEAYWSLVLCRMGIEYVEDPATGRRVPTVNRMQKTSILSDANYQEALAHADAEQRIVYRAEAEAIADIQRDILAVSSKEEPFDVFICYKDSDENGKRTLDSVRAQEIYQNLVKEGFRVFFSRITLEDKLGTAYEPYIFAALQSAKVMVAVGTRPEYFNAVWVKNEWSRYLGLIRSGADKTLIPVFEGMDPYDLPDDFAYLPSMDMASLGFMQDLIRGIRKILGKKYGPASTDRASSTQTASGKELIAEELLTRAEAAIERSAWSEAKALCELAKKQGCETGKADLYVMLANLKVCHLDELAQSKEMPFYEYPDYAKIYEQQDAETQLKLQVEQQKRLDQEASDTYERAKQEMASARSQKEYLKAAELLEDLAGYRDAAQLKEECLSKAEICRKDAILDRAKRTSTVMEIEDWERIADEVDALGDFKDAKSVALDFRRIAEKGREKDKVYHQAIALGRQGGVKSIKQQIRLFESIPGWRDADDRLARCRTDLKLERKDRRRKIIIACIVIYLILAILSNL